MSGIRLRAAGERGHAEHGWLHSHHSFSFADYYHPEHMGQSVLRVLNDDTVEPGQGFGTHPHRDMEIISWVLEGELAHRDSMGNGSIISKGEVQRMSAGTGVTHSEFNPGRTQHTHFLQVWIVPDRPGYEPGYAQQRLSEADLHNRLCCVAAGKAGQGAVSIHQDAQLYIGRLHDVQLSHVLAPGRCGYAHLARGALTLNGIAMQAGDGAYVDESMQLELKADGQAEVLLFDLPVRR